MKQTRVIKAVSGVMYQSYVRLTVCQRHGWSGCS